MTGSVEWTARNAAAMLSTPSETDDKYSRGVLGVMTGSEKFPGAAVIGVDAALHTGVGMVRYLGPRRAAELVMARRPEVVTVPGRVQAWLIGSGMDEAGTDGAGESASAFAEACASGLPVVADAGALQLAADTVGPVVITPHRGELAKLLGAGLGAGARAAVSVADVGADPGAAAATAAELTGSTVLLKGFVTRVVGGGLELTVTAPTTWLATAGSGDALAGILGALVATHSAQVSESESGLARLAATAAFIHGHAALLAGGGGPFTVLDLNAAIGRVIAQLLRDYPEE